MSERTTATTGVYAVPPDSIEHWRRAVHFEALAFWQEQDPQARATIARQLAEWSTILADREAREAATANGPTETETP